VDKNSAEPSIKQHGMAGKADFDDVYDRPDPRAYFRQLGAYDYEVPQHGQRVFRQVLDAMEVDQPTVVDLCCSYGINAALLKHDLDLGNLYDHYRSDRVVDLSSDELAALDRKFYAEKRLDNAPRVIGLDSASLAIDYALEVGLLDDGSSENLEEKDPSPKLAASLENFDLLTVTGGIGYVTERTFDRLLSCTSPDRRPWVASLCLRTVAFEPIAECLAGYGLVTEQLEDVTFPQRRFVNEEEQENALEALAARGLTSEGREAEGSYHVNVYLSRPVEDTLQRSVSEILSDLLDPATSSDGASTN
jgi:hypothetical protein